MADDKLRQELLYMVRLTSKYDFSRMEVVEGILRLENERQILGSVFGKRFKTRIFDIAAGQAVDETCVICGQHADNKVICQHCLSTIGESDYAKNKIKTKEKDKKPRIPDFKKLIDKIKSITIKKEKKEESKETVKEKVPSKISVGKVKRYVQGVLIVCLTLILFIQIWILGLWFTIPDYNPTEEARVSSNQVVPVESADDAYAQLLLDFPEEEGYTVTYSREDADYVGRFLLNPGDCCLEIEDNLTDEERYDYFFKEDVYVFYISYLEENTGKVGIAEVNHAGSILIEGSFNDGRRTDSFYKFR
ncbi:hypothetical protein [Pseudobutyrivibrio ruminis]|uniref:Uncharacterized protein n=1 Tax=Pseudobutyrivibrio ruminis DSM 9787 TaxID=1123011 RepID=A0A285T042_9FIRM|nr:hypothetical protein [Pseudobutyrivibrio ruminis]SOC13845.1 hypothetical protein SAMN02910411_0177 [Pseudobutyrivibrio ruminis DSM 9787]